MPLTFARFSQVTAQARAQRGLTLIELMTTIAVLGVLMAIAAPSFNPMLERYRVRQATEELQATLYYARSEAIKNSGGISVEPNSGSWGQGWEVKQGTAILRQTDAPGKVSITGAGTLSLDRWGTFGASSVTFTIQTTGSSNACQKLIIETSGKIEQQKNC